MSSVYSIRQADESMSVDPNERKRACLLPTCRGERFHLVHKFPMEQPRAEMWLDALGIPELREVPLERLRKTRFVCSRHFRNEDYKNPASRYLNKTAIPSINLKNLDQMDLVLHRSCPRPQNLLNEDLARSNINNRQDENIKILLNSRAKIKRTYSVMYAQKPIYKFNDIDRPSKVLTLHVDPTTNIDEDMAIQNSIPFAINSITDDNIMLQPDDICSELKNVEIITNENDPDENLSLIEFVSDEVDKDVFCNGTVTKDVIPVYTRNEGMSEGYIEVKHPDYPDPLLLNNFWLRDHCRCELCYNYDTSQRKTSVLDIPFDIKPSKTDLKNSNCLNVIWNDGHESEYDIEFLHQAQEGNYLKPFDFCERILWDHDMIEKTGYEMVSFSSLLTDDYSANTVVRNLIQYGFAFVEKVPANIDMTETVVKRLFPIQKTFFGEMWKLSNERVHCDTAYTQDYLSPHTDNAYFNDPAGLQIFHCIRHHGTGGETILVDGFHVLNELRKKHPKSFERLTEINVPAEYIEEGKHHLYSAPLIKLNSVTGDPERIRFNLYDRSVFNSIPQQEMVNFYKDFRNLAQEVEWDSNQWTFKLKPGIVLMIDNWRVLHGRHKYDGRREIVGCYVSRTEYLSTARVMQLIK